MLGGDNPVQNLIMFRSKLSNGGEMKGLIIAIIFVGLLLFGCTENLTNKKLDSIITGNSENKNCKEIAGDLFPKYVGLSHIENQGLNILLKDGTVVTANAYPYSTCMRGASGKGENINYIYSDGSMMLMQDSCSIVYSKQVVTPNGTILGHNSFSAYPIFKQYPFSISFDQSERFGLYSSYPLLINLSRSNGTYTVNWSNFNQKIFQEFYNSNNISIEIYAECNPKRELCPNVINNPNHKPSWSFEGSLICEDSKETICKTELQTISGEYSCDLTKFDSSPRCVEYGPYGSGTDKNVAPSVFLKISPDTRFYSVYEIVNPNIIGCEWITDDGRKIS